MSQGQVAPPSRLGVRIAAAVWAALGGLAGMGIGALGLLAYIVLDSQKNNMNGPGELVKFIESRVPNWMLIEMLKSGLVAALGLGVVVAGLLVAFRFRFGRLLCYLYLPVAVALHGFYLYFETTLVKPAADAYALQAQRDANNAAARWGGRVPPKTDPTQQAAANVGMVLAAGGFMFHALVLAVLAFAATPPRGGPDLDPYPVARPAAPGDDLPPA